MDGRDWAAGSVRNILINPKYAGEHVWNRYSTRLHKPRVRDSPGDWTVRDNAFPALVDRATFDKVQLILRTRHRRWSDKQLLDSLSSLLERTGYISENLVKRTAGMASLST